MNVAFHGAVRPTSVGLITGVGGIVASPRMVSAGPTKNRKGTRGSRGEASGRRSRSGLPVLAGSGAGRGVRIH